MGTLLIIDASTQNRVFGHYARVFVDMDLSKCIMMRYWLIGNTTLSTLKSNMNIFLHFVLLVTSFVIVSPLVSGWTLDKKRKD